jgi:hypothetical protein
MSSPFLGQRRSRMMIAGLRTSVEDRASDLSRLNKDGSMVTSTRDPILPLRSTRRDREKRRLERYGSRPFSHRSGGRTQDLLGKRDQQQTRATSSTVPQLALVTRHHGSTISLSQQTAPHSFPHTPTMDERRLEKGQGSRI